MKAVVFGSLNIDKVYSMPHLPEKGETLFCGGYELHVGGKGLNQCVSLKKAGAAVRMAGSVGTDGDFLVDFLKSEGIDCSLIKRTGGFTGHAVIEVDPEGQNQMILFSGANSELTVEDCERVLDTCESGDLVLMQYETSCVEYMINRAKEKGLFVALNPSPFTEKIKTLPLNNVDFLILNESEGQSLTDKTDVDDVISALRALNPENKIVLTLGGSGAVFADKNETVRVPAFKVKAVDTTCAGDTFTGFFLSSFLNGKSAAESLRLASAAAALAVTKAGAAQTIPSLDEAEEFLAKGADSK